MLIIKDTDSGMEFQSIEEYEKYKAKQEKEKIRIEEAKQQQEIKNTYARIQNDIKILNEEIKKYIKLNGDNLLFLRENDGTLICKKDDEMFSWF